MAFGSAVNDCPVASKSTRSTILVCSIIPGTLGNSPSSQSKWTRLVALWLSIHPLEYEGLGLLGFSSRLPGGVRSVPELEPGIAGEAIPFEDRFNSDIRGRLNALYCPSYVSRNCSIDEKRFDGRHATSVILVLELSVVVQPPRLFC